MTRERLGGPNPCGCVSVTRVRGSFVLRGSARKGSSRGWGFAGVALRSGACSAEWKHTLRIGARGYIHGLLFAARVGRQHRDRGQGPRNGVPLDRVSVRRKQGAHEGDAADEWKPETVKAYPGSKEHRSTEALWGAEIESPSRAARRNRPRPSVHYDRLRVGHGGRRVTERQRSRLIVELPVRIRRELSTMAPPKRIHSA